MLESSYAPIWNGNIGDRIDRKSFAFVKRFERELLKRKSRIYHQSPNKSYIKKIQLSSQFYFNLLKDINIYSDFRSIPTTNRKDFSSSIASIVPIDQNLDSLIINPTSGTTGEPILAPNHPSAIGCYVPLIEFSLNQHGVKLTKSPESTIAIQLCYQKQTLVYATSHSLSGGARFAKINIDDSAWIDPNHKQLFIDSMMPEILTGDPYAFEGAMKMGIQYKPKAIHSTALELTDSLRFKLLEYFQCPIINFYSLNETGPIAYSCPLHPEWMHILPHDIFVETLDEKGNPTNKNEYGEITITGGRNPYLPLIRYRTGDFGILNTDPCNCSDPFPRLKLLSGRKPVYFNLKSGETINPIDLARILRRFPDIYQFQIVQKSLEKFEINISCSNDLTLELRNKIITELRIILVGDIQIELKDQFPLDGKKNRMFVNEWVEKENLL
ncbi:MAG: phenylacetate--CoA ligase family protein [Leptospira sp.]|nr:phenylacetate--CoA ligase family protein [Leptospira sp.]